MKKSVICCSLCFFILGALAPKILSITFAKPFIEKRLSQKFKSNVYISKVDLNWFGPQTLSSVSIQKQNLELHAELISSKVPIWRITDFSSEMDIAKISAQNSDTKQTLQNAKVSIHLPNIQIDAEDSSGGKINVSGQFGSKNSADLKFSSLNFSSSFLDIFYPQMPPSTFLGSSFSGNGTITSEGEKFILTTHVLSNILSMNLEFSWDGKFLTLLKPLSLKFSCNQDCSSSVLNFFPNDFLTKFALNDPITLDVRSLDLKLPPTDQNFAAINLGITDLNLGRVSARVGHSLQSFRKLFEKANLSENLNLWFSPIVFSANQTILQLQRMDVLINQSFSVFLWGNINLKDHSLAMTLAIPSKTLRQVFGVTQAPPNYNFLIKISGTIDHPNFDLSSALGKILILKGIKQGLNQIPSPAGKIFGNAVDLFQQSTNNVPEPPRQIPWEK